MRYPLAVICPPLAFLACGKWGRAALSAALFLVAIATARSGIGVALDFILVLWAFATVADQDAQREALAFIEASNHSATYRGR